MFNLHNIMHRHIFMSTNEVKDKMEEKGKGSCYFHVRIACQTVFAIS